MDYLPFLLEPEASGLSLWWLALAGMLIIAQFALRQFARKQQNVAWLRTAQATLWPFFVIVSLLLVRSTVQLIPEETLRAAVNQTNNVLLIAAATWWILAALRIFKMSMLRRFDMSVEDNFHARQVHTRIAVLYRIVCFFVVIIAMAFALMTFDAVRAVGTSLLAGAGVTGIILGFAAQKTLGAVFAGIQIALTQPIKIDDAVVIEGEWGWIEEITLTYVVVRIWDLRRLIVPITYFIDNPIQNWTRREAEIIGTVILYTDYTLDIESLRAELNRLLENNRLWNKKVNVLQVVDVTENTVQLRALMSARNSPQAWDLRCAVREGLITYLQTHQPQALPRTRVELPKEYSASPQA